MKKAITLRTWLILLVLVTAVPLLVFAVGVVVWHTKTEREFDRQQATRNADAAMQAVDRELSGAITGLEVLAASPALRSGDLESFYAQARAAVGIAGNSVIILYRRDGTRLISTSVPFGQPLAPRADMSAIATPFETGKPHVTRLFMSETIKRPTLGVIVPVRMNGKVPYVLGAGLLSESLTQLLRNSGIPARWVATLVDQDGTIIARTANPDRFVGKRALAENWDRIRQADQRTGGFEGRTQEGDSVSITFARSDKSGWTTVIGIPKEALDGQLRQSLTLVAAIGLTVLACAALLAWWAAKSIYWPSHLLENAAAALKEGKGVTVPPTGIEQFDHLAEAMATAGAVIHERESRLSQSLAELRHAHEQLRQTNEQLRHEQAKKDDFIATLSHELRNPLAPLTTGLFVLRQQPSPAITEQTLGMMERQLRHMVRLIEDLLDVSRITRGKITLRREIVPIQQIVRQAVDGSTPLIEAGGLEFAVDMPEEPICVNADSARLAQVLTNVLANASKFTRRGGSISLRVATDGRMLTIEVRDTGIGIPTDKLESIFDIFVQVHDEDVRHPGLGLGLSLARLLVELHDGSIQAWSEGKDRGATFAIRLPIAASTPDATVLPLHRDQAARPLRILLVDDNVDAAQTLAMALRGAGHTVYTAHNGRAALNIARGRPVDVVLLDIGMPGLDGYEVCRVLRKTPGYERVKIVAVTGWGADADRRCANAAGFDVHLTKPVQWTQIQEVLVGT